MNQPSEEAMRNMLRFLLKTSVPRILAEMEAEKEAKLHENQRQSVEINVSK